MAEEAKVPNAELQSYLDDIAAYEREFKKWESRVDKIFKRYRDDRGNKALDKKKFNTLWANTQTLVPACFSRLPKPDVRRRFNDNDPGGRVGALILERALEFEVQHYPDFKKAMKSAVRARFLGGRGVAWARYEPHISSKPNEPQDGVQVTEDVDDIQVEEQLDYECAPVDYVNYKDFGHSIARTWEEVTRVWRKVYMGDKAFRERFPEKDFQKLYKNGKPVVPFDATPTDEMKSARSAQEAAKKQACIYELADKEGGVFVWISKSFTEILDEREDPLKLQEFFPCPEPLYATMTEDSLIPVPDFTIYQDQADSLDTASDRIYGLIDMLKVIGVYDGSADSALGRMLKECGNGDLQPVKNWTAFAEKQGIKGQIDILDLTQIANALKSSVEAFVQKKNEMDELSGVIDVIRGQVDPKEKLGQTQMKGQYANLRLRDKQQDVAEFATGLLRLKAQIICGKFNPKTIMAMAAIDQLSPDDQQLVPAAMELLLGKERLQDPNAESPNPLRSFRIEVAADTLVQIDEDAEKEAATEFLVAVGSYLKQAAEVGAAAPQLVPLILELLKWGVSRFKIGKGVEGTIDAAIEQLKQMVQQQAANPQPDPKVEAEKAKAQVAKEKGAIDIQVAREKMQIEREKMAGQQQMQQQQMQIDQQQNAQEAQFSQQDMQMKGQMQQQDMAMKQEQMQAQHQQKMQQAQMPKRAK